MIDTVGTSALLCSSQWNIRHQMTVFTAQTNLVVWMMASLQLRDLWFHHLNIYKNIYLMGAFWVNRSEYIDKMKSLEKIKRTKSKLCQGGFNSKLLFTNAISLCHFYRSLTKSVLMVYFTLHHNLWSEGCLVTQHILCLKWPSGIQSHCSYWLFGGNAH